MSSIDSKPASGSPGRSLVYEVALKSDVGKVRTENQDFGLTTTPEELDPSRGILMIVADGMGGHRGGATASRLAATTIRTIFLERGNAGDATQALVEAVQEANARVFGESQSNSQLRGMGTTATTLLVHGDKAAYAHVGDSRLYRMRDGALEQLTDDHSLVATMVREGLLTNEEAAVHPRRNVLQRSLGVAAEIDIDRKDGIDVLPGDTFLLSSDGLHGFVAADSIREALSLPVRQAADRCIELAHAAGAPDNVTVVICRAAGGGPGDPGS